MVELKFKDLESLNAVTSALHKNGYSYSTFVIWLDGEISHYTVKIDDRKPFTVRVEGVNNGK
jgi:hypothetical protein